MDPYVNEESLFDDDDDLNELQENDDPPTDGFLTATVPLLSLEYYKVIFEQQHPTTSQWRDVEKPNACNVSSSIDRARKTMGASNIRNQLSPRKNKDCFSWKRSNSGEYMGAHPRSHAMLV